MSTRRRSRSEAICGALSVVLPTALYLVTAAQAPTWLDSAEFMATGFVLGAAHPPGHPVIVTLIKILTMIPLSTAGRPGGSDRSSA